MGVSPDKMSRLPEQPFVAFPWTNEAPVEVLDEKAALELVEAFCERWGVPARRGSPKLEGFVRGERYLAHGRDAARWRSNISGGRWRFRDEERQDAVYFPCVEHAALHRTFADIPPASDAAVKDFADKYGLLGVPISKLLPMERLKTWDENIHWMRTTVQALDALNRADASFFENRFDWADPPGLSVFRPIPDGDDCQSHPADRKLLFGKDYFELWSDSHGAVDVLRPFRDRDPLAAGELAVLETVQSFLNDWTGGGLLALPGPGKGTLRNFSPWLSLRPRNLLGALWANVAAEITRAREIKQCRRVQCGEWFWPEGKGRRKNAQYCSDNCRDTARNKRKYENRKERATKRKEGKSK
jgi:hypothetical protein